MHDALLPKAQRIARHIRSTGFDSAVEVIIDLIVKLLEFGLFTGLTIGFALALAIQIWFGG